MGDETENNHKRLEYRTYLGERDSLVSTEESIWCGCGE